MTIQSDRQLVEHLTDQARIADRNKLSPMLGIVVEVGAGATAGMVRIRRHPHEPTDVGRPFYYCVGIVPSLGATVWCHANFATGFVYGDFIEDAGVTQVADSGTVRPSQDTVNFGTAISAVDNPGSARTDVALTPSELLATPSVDGFMPSADKTKVNSVETGAQVNPTDPEIFSSVLTQDGAGTNLNADLVDGQHASSFADVATETTVNNHVGATGGAHGNATTSVAGFMAAADKTKLNSISSAAKGEFIAGLSTSQLNITNATAVKVQFDSLQYSSGESWFSTGNRRYLPLEAGTYWFSAGLLFAPGVASQRLELWLRVNGVEQRNIGTIHTSNTGHATVTGSSLAVLDGIDDYVDIYIFHTFGVNTSDIIAGAGTFFQGFKIGT